MPRWFAIACTTVFLLSGVGIGAEKGPDLPDGLYAIIHTLRGNVTCRLEMEKAPLTVTSFVGLADGTVRSTIRPGKRFFDGLTLHRVEKDALIQGGCPEGTGRGGPGYRFANEIHPDLRHDKPGILAMANAGPNTNGSQFYITMLPMPKLDGSYNVFGMVVDGMDAVRAIRRGDRIKRIEILRVGQAARAFKTDQAAFDKLHSEGNRAALSKTPPGVVMDAKDMQSFLATGIEQLQKRMALLAKAKATASGLVQVVIAPGKGDAALKLTDTALIHFSLSPLDGPTIQDTFATRSPVPIDMAKAPLPRGWKEALLQMAVGERRILFLSPHLGFGRAGVGGGLIGPDTPVLLDVELVGVKPAKTPAPSPPPTP